MTLSNTAVPKYYGQFRDRVMAGEIPVNHEIEMEMNRIDDLINNPGIFVASMEKDTNGILQQLKR